MSLIQQLLERVSGKAPKGAKRSSSWSTIRKAHLKDNPNCAVCESKKKVEVHHKVPFHISPGLELEKTNLVSLCENNKYGIKCHLLIGHLGNYKKFNDDLDIDIFTWHKKIKE